MSIDEERFEVPVASTSKAGAAELLRGTTLLVPCVSIGSVPQLAVDALLVPDNVLQNDELVHVCDLDHRFCVPFAGASASRASGKSPRTPLQVFVFRKARLAVLQQRSPILKSRKGDFVRSLRRWIGQHHFREVIVLTSVDAGMRSDEEMSHAFWTLPAQGQASQTAEPGAAPLSAALRTKLPRYAAQSQGPQGQLANLSLDAASSALPPLPAAGLARRYLMGSSNDDARATPTSALIVFAAEGDNRADGLAMAHLVRALLTGEDKPSAPHLREPADWRLVFGGPIHDGLF